MNNKLFVLLSSACVYLLASTSIVNAGILKDDVGNYVTDRAGECVSVGEMTHYHKHDKRYCGEKPRKKAVKKARPLPAPVVQKDKQSISIEAQVLFAFNSDTLKPEGKQYLEDVRQKYKFYEANSISIVGHSDSTGPEAYNQGLSERRAMTVRNYLVETGSDAAKITTAGKGESEPVADNSTAGGRQKNRRVDISIGAIEK